jgi:hypothetical protein
MNNQQILYPFFGMILLSFLTIYNHLFTTLKALRNKEVRLSYFKLFSGTNAPDYLEASREHYKNIFQIPILFYVLVLFLFVSDAVQFQDLIFAYAFLFWRVLHFLTRVFVYEFIRLRFYCFVFGVITITIHWAIVFNRFITLAE